VSASDFGDFLKQVPIHILLAPVVFGVIYVSLMVIVFRRAAARRKKKREAELGLAPAPESAASAGNGNSMLSFLRGQLPDQPLELAAWTVPSALRDVPEPDLDLLATPASLQEQPLAGETVSGTEAPVKPPEPDWVSMVAPAPVAARPETAFPAVPDALPVAESVPPPGDAVEVLRAWRDLSDGSLIVQMGDQRYRTLADIQGADLARRFAALVRELNTLAGGGPARSTGNMPAVSDPGLVIPPPETSAGSMKARLGVLQVTGEPAKPSVLKQMTRRLGREEAKSQPPTPPGIADAVETFLQELIETFDKKEK